MQPKQTKLPANSHVNFIVAITSQHLPDAWIHLKKHSHHTDLVSLILIVDIDQQSDTTDRSTDVIIQPDSTNKCHITVIDSKSCVSML